MFIRKTFFFCMILSLLFILPLQTFAAKPVPNSAVSYTAPISLYWLSKAKVPEAVEYVKYIDAESILKPENISQYERVEKVNKIYHEIRYTSLNDFILSENYSNVMDLGCGISPRCLFTAENKINYVGVELPDVVEMLNVYAPNFLNDDAKKFVRFVAADVADRNGMMNAAKNFDGEICIVEEDLLAYLPREKQKAMLENIRDILKEHGGCFVTSDFVAGEIFMSSDRIIYGDEDALTIAKETQKVYENLSQILFNDTMFKSADEAINFVESCGLKVELRPVLKNISDIRSVRDLNNRDISAINDVTSQKLLWVITAK